MRIGMSRTVGFGGKVSINHLGIIFACCLLMPLLLVMNSFIPSLPLLVRAILAVGIVYLIAKFFALRIRRETALVTVNTLLSAGRCGSCAYNIASTPAHEDDCIHCPECGAAWNSSRVSQRQNQHAPQYPSTLSYQHSFFDSILELWNRTPTVVDGTQRAVSIVDPSLRFPPVAMPHKLVPQARQLIRKRTRTIRILWGVFILFLMVAFFDPNIILNPSLFIETILNRMQTLGLYRSFAKLIWYAWVYIVFPLFLYRMWTCRSQLTAKKATQALLELNLCPACGSLLPQDHSPAPDANPLALTQCTHCAAAWSLPTSAHR